jgi:hypothetical protein
MSLFSDLFHSKPHYPPLEPGAPVTEKLNKVRSTIETLASTVKDPLEVVPAGEGAYIYIGKPPKHFGMAWVEKGVVKNFKILAEEQGLKPADLTEMQEKLRVAYERHQSEPRYSASIAGRDIVLIQSPGLEEDVKGIFSQTVH